MRVLHVHSGNLFGGVERILETLAEHQLEARMQSAFALCFDGRLAARLSACGAPPAMIGPVRTSRPWEITGARNRLSELLRRQSPDVAVVHSSWTQALLAPAIRRAGVPVVRWLHAPEPGTAPLEWAAARVPLDLVICNSRYTCDASSGRFPEAPRRICYAPLSLPECAPSRREELRRAIGTTPGAVVIAMAARMEAWKGHRVLLDALGALAVDPRWHAWIIGGAQRPEEAEYASSLQQQTARLGITDRVTFLGQREDVARLLGAADVYCQPNVGAEPFGISFVEALAAGLPVVATRLGAAGEIVNATCGVLVEPHAPAAVAAALLRLLDVGTRREMRDAAFERAQVFGDLDKRMADVADAFAAATASRHAVSSPVPS